MINFAEAERPASQKPAANVNQITPSGQFEGNTVYQSQFKDPPEDFTRPEAIGRKMNRGGARPPYVDISITNSFPTTTTMRDSYQPSPEGSPTTKLVKPTEDPLSPGSIRGLPFQGESLSSTTYIEHPISPVKLLAPAKSTAFDDQKGLPFTGESLMRTDFAAKTHVEKAEVVIVQEQGIDHTIRFDAESTYRSDYTEKQIDTSNKQEAKSLNESQRKASIALV